MPFLGRTQAEIAQELKDAYVADGFQPDADISGGTVNKDLIDVAASELSEAYDEFEDARKTASLQNALFMSTDAISRWGMNYDVLQADATFAIGTAYFQAKNQPTSIIYIPKGTLVWTQPKLDGTILKYRTSAEATLTSAATKDSVTGYYEVEVAVVADTAGTDQHVGRGSLVVLPNRISGIDFVYNKVPINTASNQDTNEDVADNVLAVTDGTNLGTATGYEDDILAAFPDDVEGVKVVGPFEDDNERVQYYNEVDVPIIPTSEDGESFTAVLTTHGTKDTRFGDDRPVKTVTSVVGATNGTVYAENVNYGFEQDTGVVFGYSRKAFDGLCWFPNQTPGAGLKLTVQGTKAGAVGDVQDYLDNKTRKYITGDLLVKEAQKILVDFVLTVSATSGAAASQVQADIEEALNTYLNALELGDDVIEDDIVKLLQDLTRVSAVSIPISVKKSTASTYDDSVTIKDQEFARPGSYSVSLS